MSAAVPPGDMNIVIAARPGYEPVAAELHENGDITVWSFSVWGPIGPSGTPHPDTVLRPPKNKRERELVASMRKLVERAMECQDALVGAARAARG